jgi:hypothetical protein
LKVEIKKSGANKDKAERARQEMNKCMDQLVVKMNGKLNSEKKIFKKLGINESIKTDDIENLIKKL